MKILRTRIPSSWLDLKATRPGDLQDPTRRADRNGHRVHTAAMNNLRTTYPQAQRLLIMTSTYGDGGAGLRRPVCRPATAVQSITPSAICGAGLGDRQFENFCAYASSIEHMLTERGWDRCCPYKP